MSTLGKLIGIVWLVATFLACPSKRQVTKEQAALSAEEAVVLQPIPCPSELQKGLLHPKMNGISLVAPPRPFEGDPFQALSELGADWVAVLPYAYFKKNQPNIYAFTDNNWWGERTEGIALSTKLAHQNGLKVMLKPQLWTHDQWIGDLQMQQEKDWQTLEQQYERFIIRWAGIADSLKVELLCIGTEMRHVVQQRPTFWRQLIPKIRLVYGGQLTYAPNWDSYQQVKFWDQLDFIGVDAYFPLLQADTPSVCALKEAWIPYVRELKAFANQYGRPLIFTEYGYLSLDGTAHNTWELEKDRKAVNINELAQANALQALLEVFGNEAWWAGGFIWKWYPSYKSAMGEGEHARDYTPQGKQAQAILKQLFTKP